MTQFPETKAGRGTRRSRTRRALRAGGSATLIVAISFALIELGLQVASLFAEDRSGVWEPGAEVRVLCVGDSHTWGAGVSREQSYPAHLQNHLDELAPGRYSVLQRYQPDVVVLWAGVNNAWNRADAEESSEIRYAWLEGLVSHLRTYRLVRVWLHDRKLAHYVAEHRSERRWHQVAAKDPLGPRARFTVGYDGVVEEIQHEGALVHSLMETEGEDWVEAWLERDLAFLAQYARSAGVSVVLVTYPIPVPWFATANRAIRQTATRFALPLVESGPAGRRLAPEEAEWFRDGHPGGPVYREIARDIAGTLLELTRPER